MRTAQELELRKDEFVIAFQGAEGFRAEDLGKFLQRAGAVIPRSSVELRVVGFEAGSFLVRCRALTKRIGKNAKIEAIEKPVRTVLATVGVAIAAAALANAMSVDDERVPPLASESARIVDRYNVRNITLITIDQTIVVMTPEQAEQIKETEARRSRGVTRSSLFYELSRAVRDNINGQIFDVGGVLHFRPDGYQFTVPISHAEDYPGPQLRPLGRYSIRGSLHSSRGQPEVMEIAEASELD